MPAQAQREGIGAKRAYLSAVASTLDFRGQPFDEAGTAGAFLRRTLGDPELTAVTAAVAWARFRGLVRLKDALEAFRERGGFLRIIVGIDEGGATRPGLMAELTFFDEAYVFHDPSSRTFHPKIYLADGPRKAILLVGSSNATPGGLFANYEASLEATFELPRDEDASALVDAKTYIELLLDDNEICMPLDEALVENLVQDARYAVSGHERRTGPERRAVPHGADKDDIDATGSTQGGAAPLFGKSKHAKAAIPPLSAEARDELAELELEETLGGELAGPPAPAVVPVPSGVAARPAPALVAFAQWSKQLARADAQQPTESGTNPTGVLRLAKAGHDIDHLTWFRHTLFALAGWQTGTDSRGNLIETARIPMDVVIGARSLGRVDVHAEHAPHREAGQGNVPSTIHWGPTLGPLLRSTDFTGHTVTISRMSDGTFRLDITP